MLHLILHVSKYAEMQLMIRRKVTHIFKWLITYWVSVIN